MLMTDTTTPCKAVSFRNLLLFCSETPGRQLVALFVAHLSPLSKPFLLPLYQVVGLIPLQVAESQSCFVTSGAAHNSRSTAGTPSALHQQHLTPAQQATQAAITAPATHQDGKVPVRTGLAWAALGTPFPQLLMHAGD